MNDLFNKTLRPGERGYVSGIDDIGTVFVNWDCGLTLGCCYGVDELKVIDSKVNDDVIAELLELRRHPNCPVLYDVKSSYEHSRALGLDALAEFIFAETGEYKRLIFAIERGKGR
jgi:hypothetical protein